MLLNDFPLGIMIRFEHYMKKYQNPSNNYTDITIINSKITTTNELPCTTVQPSELSELSEKKGNC